MIKLSRTHPRHLAGTQSFSSRSPRSSIHRRHEASRFGRMLREALDGVTHSLGSSHRATPLSLDFFRPLFLLNQVHQNRKLSPVGPTAKSHPTGGANSLSTPSKDTRHFEAFIEEASRSFGVEKALIRAVMKAESNFNPKAKSRSGAVGLMQLLPSTAREVGVSDLYDPRENIMGGTRYLAMLLDRYEGNLELALTAYNWGLGNLEKTPDQLPRETVQYVQKVLRYMETLTA